MKWFIILTIALNLQVFGSKVVCNSLYTLGKITISNTPFIPMSVFIQSEKDIYAIRSWALKRNSSSIGPGIAIMHRTAHEAAQKALKSLNISTDDIYVFPKPTGNFITDFGKVVEVMRERKYQYIQNAVILSPQGIYTILPLAKYDALADTYVPVVIKGHQDLQKTDMLAAAITSDAIGRYMGSTSKTATVSLRPIVPKRLKSPIAESEHIIQVENHKVNIQKMYENFIKEYNEFSDLLEEQYSSYFTAHPQASSEDFLESIIDPLLTPAENELTQMSYAPNKKQRAKLLELGYSTQNDLALVDINSEEFLRITLLANIAPYRLKRFIAKSKAFVTNKPVITQETADLGTDLDYVLHFDIEAFMDHDIKSGSYYLGLEFQAQKDVGAPVKEYIKGDKNPDKYFIGGFKEPTQENVDLAWVDFFKILKTDNRLKNGRYKITVYSSYEEVKINQLLEIRKDDPRKFTEEEKLLTVNIKGKNYPLYHERDVYQNIPGFLGPEPVLVKRGYLINRLDFFQKHQDINPLDVFNYLDKIVDLLPISRHNIAWPGKNNSIKTILAPAQDDLPANLPRFKYGDGDNGLNCIAWYFQYVKTGDPEILERIRLYLEMDIRANRIFWDFLRRNSGKQVQPENLWTTTSTEKLEMLLPIFKRNNFIASMSAKKEALQKVLGQSLQNLEANEIATAAEILDRSSYLDERKLVMMNKKFSKTRVKAILSHMKHDYESGRKKLFLEFIKSMNPKLNIDNLKPEMLEALNYLLTIPSGQLSKGHLANIIFMEQIESEVIQTAKDLNMKPLTNSAIDVEKLKSQLTDPDMLEKIKSLKMKNFRLIKYNEDMNTGAREYGYGDEFEHFEKINMKAVWEGLLLQYLLGAIK